MSNYLKRAIEKMAKEFIIELENFEFKPDDTTDSVRYAAAFTEFGKCPDEPNVIDSTAIVIDEQKALPEGKNMSRDYIEQSVDDLIAKIQQEPNRIIAPDFKELWLQKIYEEQIRTGYVFSSLKLHEDGTIEATWKNPHS